MILRSFVTGVMVFLLTFTIQAQQKVDIARLVPQDALFYINLNLDDENIKSSGLSRLLEDEAVKKFIDSLAENFGKMSAKNTDKELSKAQKKLKLSDEKIKEIKELAESGKLWEMVKGIIKGRVALYIPAPQDSKFNDMQKDLQLVILAETDNNSDNIDALLNLCESIFAEKVIFSEIKGNTFKVKKMAPKEANDKFKNSAIYFSYNKDYLIVSNNLDTSINLFGSIAKGGLAENITGTEGYAKTLKESPKNPVNSGFINVKKILSSIPPSQTPQPDAQGNPMPSPVATPEKVLDALGISSVKSIGWFSSIEKDGTTISKSLIYAPGEKKGLIKLLSSSPSKMTLPSYYPKTLGVYEAIRMNPNTLFNSIVEMGMEINPANSMIIDMVMETVKQKHGLDIKEQLLKAFGEEHSFAMIFKNMPQDFAAINPNMAPMMMSFDLSKSLLITAELKDTELFKNTITILQTIIGKSNPMFASSFEVDYNGQKITVVGMSMPGAPAACYFINNNRLFFALSQDTLKTIIDGFGNKENSLSVNPLFQKTLEAAGTEDSVGFTTINEAVYFGYYSEIIKQFIKIAIHREKSMAAIMKQKNAQENNEGQNQEQTKKAKEHPLETLIDFSLWPKPEVFKKYMGFSVVKVIPEDDGIRMTACSKPKPASK